MALFPRIQSPCPFKGDILQLMDGDTCRLCRRRVFDLGAMSDDERVAFLKGCSEEVCVTYKFPLRPAIAAAALATAVMAPTALAACEATAEMVIVAGGIKDPANAQYVQAPVDKSVPALPVVYEPATSPPAKAPS